jgi:hypothetical protein
MHFTAVQDFYSEETRSQYLSGLGYTARDEDHILFELIPRWLEEGKIVKAGGESVLAGIGTVE